jgi:hypothetical protein
MKIAMGWLLVFFLAVGSTNVAKNQEQEGDGGVHIVGHCEGREMTFVLDSLSAMGLRCMDAQGETHHIDLGDVCAEQYDGTRPFPIYATVYNPFSWSCVSEVTTETISPLPELPSAGGGMHLEPFCQYHPSMVGSHLQLVDENSSAGYRCAAVDGTTYEIDMQLACDWMYPFTRVVHRVNSNHSWGNSCEEVESDE